MKRTLKVRVGGVTSALDRFEEVWSKAALVSVAWDVVRAEMRLAA